MFEVKEINWYSYWVEVIGRIKFEERVSEVRILISYSIEIINKLKIIESGFFIVVGVIRIERVEVII